MSNHEQNIVLRHVELQDCADLLTWRNEIVTRENSFNNNIIKESAHKDWFSKVYNNNDHLILIGVKENKKIGMVRFDRLTEDSFEININIAPESRGKGLGRIILRESLSWVNGKVVAKIKNNNISSIKAFKFAGFQITCENNDYISLEYISNKNV